MYSKADRKYLERQNKKYTSEFIEISKDTWPPHPGEPPIKVFRNNKFLIQVYTEKNNIIRLSICRTTVNKERFNDGISWDELQSIKNNVGYADLQAIEIFPKERDLVNVANMRHLWVLPYTLEFGWYR